MNVLSLFDGMSCAMIALYRVGIKPDNYFASEIDKYAIQVSKANWPQIKHIGDVSKINYFEGTLYTEFGQYEVSFAKSLICGGSPCQGFSFAGKQLNFEDPRSKLFFEFVRIYREIKAEHPDVKVFLENVIMKKEYQAVISEKLGFEPVLINSALVSAQNRKRLYWTNIPFQGQPTDRCILLKHILETDGEGYVFDKRSSEEYRETGDKSHCINSTYQTGAFGGNGQRQLVGVILNCGEYQERNEKAMCLDANYWKGADNHGQRTLISTLQVGMADDIKGRDQNRRIYSDEGKSPTLIGNTGGHHEPKIAVSYPASIIGRKLNERGVRDDYNADVPITQCLQVKHNPDKIGCLTTVDKDNVITEMLPGRYEDVYNNPTITYRKLTTTECERLQCVPDGYTSVVSNTQAYKMLGNGWNVETIVHLFEPLLWLDIL